MKIYRYLKFASCFTFCAASFFFLPGCHTINIESLQKEIDSISFKRVPDKRIGICKVEAESTNDKTIILKGETTDPMAKQDIINAVNNLRITFIDSILILPDTVLNKYYRGLVTLSVANLRREPDHAAELVSQATMGTPMLILKSANSWLQVQTPDRYISWTESSSVMPMNSREVKAWKDSERVIFLENTGWIYSSPDENGVTGDIVAGCILQKNGVEKGYAMVMMPDGRTGYIGQKKIMDFKEWKNKVDCNAEGLISRAASYLGIPYLWGGSSPKGADCSGFVQSVFFMNGIILQRDASLQALHGQPVDLKEGYRRLLPGDLLFFGSTKNDKPRVTHTAIYIGGNEYINSSGMVRINSLDSLKANFSSYRKNSLLLARRIIGATNDEGIIPVRNHPWY